MNPIRMLVLVVLAAWEAAEEKFRIAFTGTLIQHHPCHLGTFYYKQSDKINIRGMN